MPGSLAHAVLNMDDNLSVTENYLMVDSLDDLVWSQVMSRNKTQLESLSLDQRHSLSGDRLEDILTQHNNLQVLNVWSCRFITVKHRDQFKKLTRTENYDVSIR